MVNKYSSETQEPVNYYKIFKYKELGYALASGTLVKTGDRHKPIRDKPNPQKFAVGEEELS